MTTEEARQEAVQNVTTAVASLCANNGYAELDRVVRAASPRLTDAEVLLAILVATESIPKKLKPWQLLFAYASFWPFYSTFGPEKTEEYMERFLLKAPV